MKQPRPAIFATFNDTATYTEAMAFQFSGSAAEAQEDGLVKKGILRTGHWGVTPTAAGKLKKPLTIVKEGKSDYDKGIIALSDVVATFGADGHLVQVPLAKADQPDHANKTINNTGFVRQVWIEDRPEWGEGEAELMGAIDFTEAEVKAKVMAGTYADVSSGVPWVETSDGYSAFLDHVCITNKPFVKGMTGWMFSGDEDDVDVAVAVLDAPPDEADPAEVFGEFFYGERIKQIAEAMEGLNLHGYEVVDVSDSKAVVKNEVAGKTWLVPYAIVDGTVLLASTSKWEVKDQTEPDPPIDDLPSREEAEKESKPPAPTHMSALERAQKERELRLSQTNKTGGAVMPQNKSILSVLEGVELSEEQRAALEAAEQDAANARRAAREGEATKRIDELKDLGVTTPGALKLYRKVFLADDGGPAAVLLSDDGTQTREVKAIEILDLFIDACKGDQGKVQFSDQAIDTGNHNKPPTDSTGENGSLDERTASAKEFLKLSGATK